MNKLELLEELRKLDEVTLLEVLEITSEELVDAFPEKIDDNLDKIYKTIQETL